MDLGCMDGVGVDQVIVTITGWNGTAWVLLEEGFVQYPYELTFDEECEHILFIEVWDSLGNYFNDTEIFYVDDSAPELTKVIGTPAVNVTG
jgi:hypothetical protein